jgi:hypothetical protein
MKSILKIFLLVQLLFIIPGSKIIEKHPNDISFLIPAQDKELMVGEEITYTVSYTFIKLGEVKLRVVNKQEFNGKPYYNVVCYMDSYDGIPLVNLHQIYESKLNQDYFSAFFRGTVKKEEYTTYTEYNFDYMKSIIHVKQGKVSPPQLWEDTTLSAEKMYQDGLSIFYYARMNTGQQKSVSLPCFVNEKKVNTNINFYNTPEKVKIDAVNYDINCVKLDGNTDFVSVYGLTGYFEGWFSNDNAAIPIIAKMKVIIGNVTLELKSWSRPDGWNPPKWQS